MQNKENQILVSVCTLTYNHEHYVRQCLDGILKQKRTFAMELLIHDDASPDHTAEVIKEYESKYPDLILPIYQTENQCSKGISVSSVFNFSRVRGKYIALCEGDDFWTDENKLQKQVDFLESHPDFSAVVHQCARLNQNTGEITYRPVKKAELSIDDMLRETPAQTATFMFRTSILDGCRIPDVLSEDKAYLILMALRGRVAFLSDCMSVYRKNDGGVSSHVRFNDIKMDLRLPAWGRTLNPAFPYYRHKSFIYETMMKYSCDISLFEKWRCFVASSMLSFSYFPGNMRRIYRNFKGCVKATLNALKHKK